MIHSLVLVAFAAIAGIMAGPPLASAENPEVTGAAGAEGSVPLQAYVQDLAAGQIDWAALSASAWGKTLWVPQKGRVGWERIIKAKAKADAEQKLLSVLEAVPVTAELTLKDRPELIQAVRHFVQSAEPAGERKGRGNHFELKLEVHLSGQDELVKALRSAMGTGGEKLETSPSGPAQRLEGPTAVVVDARGLDSKAVLWPRLLDEAGSVLLDFTGSAEMSAWRSASVAYLLMRSFAEADRPAESAGKEDRSRLGSRPLLLKAVRAEGANAGDLVLGSLATSSLMETSGAMDLAQQRGIFVLLDPPPLSIQRIPKKPRRRRPPHPKRPSLQSEAPGGG